MVSGAVHLVGRPCAVLVQIFRQGGLAAVGRDQIELVAAFADDARVVPLDAVKIVRADEFAGRIDQTVFAVAVCAVLDRAVPQRAAGLNSHQAVMECRRRDHDAAVQIAAHDVHVAVEQSVLEHIALRNGRLFIEDHVADRLFLIGRENVHSLTGGADHGAGKTRRRHGEVSLGVGEPAVERVRLLSAFCQEEGIVFQPFDRIVFGRYDDLSGLHVDDSVVMA